MDRRIRQSRSQETQQAARLGGRRTISSGNQWIQKNDLRTAEWSIELKTTEKKQYILKQDELLLAEKNAILDGREMAFGIRMGGRDWIVLAQESFESLLAGSSGDASAHPGPGLGS